MLNKLWFVFNNKLSKDLSIYFLSQIFTALLPIVIIPVISRSLSIDEYGNYSLYKSIFGFILPLIGLSFSNAVVRKYYSMSQSDYKSYILTLIFILFFSTLLFYLLIQFNLELLLSLLKIDNSLIIFYAIYVAFLTSISSIFLGYYRVTHATGKFLVSNMVIVIITIIGVFLLEVQNELILNNLLFVHLLAILISIIYNAADYLKNNRKFELDFSNIKDTLLYCWPLIIYSILAQIYAIGDRFIINYYLDKESLAIYSAGLQMAFAIPILGKSIQLAWTPYVFENIKKGKESKLKYISLYLTIALIVFSILYIIIYPFIFNFFLPNIYNAALEFFILFIVAGFFQSSYWLFSPFLLYYERNVIFIYITLLAAIISVALNFLIVEYGLIWVATVFMLSWIIQFIALLLSIKYVTSFKKIKQEN